MVVFDARISALMTLVYCIVLPDIILCFWWYTHQLKMFLVPDLQKD